MNFIPEKGMDGEWREKNRISVQMNSQSITQGKHLGVYPSVFDTQEDLLDPGRYLYMRMSQVLPPDFPLSFHPATTTTAGYFIFKTLLEL